MEPKSGHMKLWKMEHDVAWTEKSKMFVSEANARFVNKLKKMAFLKRLSNLALDLRTASFKGIRHKQNYTS